MKSKIADYLAELEGRNCYNFNTGYLHYALISFATHIYS
jgi:hypothetical protein